MPLTCALKMKDVTEVRNVLKFWKVLDKGEKKMYNQNRIKMKHRRSDKIKNAGRC